MVKVVKSQPADHSTKGTESAVLTTDHVVSSDQRKKYMALMNRARKEHRMILVLTCSLNRLGSSSPIVLVATHTTHPRTTNS